MGQQSGSAHVSVPLQDETDGRRAHLRAMWSAVASGWAQHADFTDDRHAATTRRLLEVSSPRAGERVLELACGAGGVGLLAARLVAPGGEVVLTDVAPEMVAAAGIRAQALGLSNVSARVLDLHELDEPDASYDVVLCRDGLQFAVDPARAVSRIARVLRPGGRLALATWGARELNPWLGLVLDAVTAETGRQMPPPGLPGPFSLPDADVLVALLGAHGLTGVTVEELVVPMQAPSFDAWWARTTTLAGPLAAVLASVPTGTLARLKRRTLGAVAPYETPAGLIFPGTALVAGARRPGR